MRDYNYDGIYQKLLTPGIVALLGQIHEYKGEQALLIGAKGGALTQLTELAKIQSTEASNRIEGIFTSDERLKKLVRDKTMPRTRNEQEIAGYRDVLAAIHENYDYIPLRPSAILQLHRDLYRFSGKSIGGAYKNSDNVIQEIDEHGNKFVRFQPVPAWTTPEAVERACRAFNEAAKSTEYDPLLLIPVFILDFLCIHPFNDGNGRMSRLLTLLLLCRAGYFVGKYISIEKLIERTEETYYDALQQSSVGWHKEGNDYAPFARYLLGVILAACREFSAQSKILTAADLSKPDRVLAVIKDAPGKITKAEIMQKCQDISQITIQRALSDLQKRNKIIKLGGGRYTAYTWNREKP